MTPRGLHGLPAIDPRLADRATRAIGALTGRTVAGALSVASVAPVPDLRGDWLWFDNGCAIALDRLDGEACRFAAADGFAAAALIANAEALLRAIEAALAIELEPDRVTAEPPPGAMIAALSTRSGSTIRDRLRIALPPALDLLPAPPELALELVGSAAVPVTFTASGPRLAPHDAADLAPGDCILLGTGALDAALVTAGGIRIRGRLDPAKRRFTCGHPSEDGTA